LTRQDQWESKPAEKAKPPRGGDAKSWICGSRPPDYRSEKIAKGSLVFYLQPELFIFFAFIVKIYTIFTYMMFFIQIKIQQEVHHPLTRNKMTLTGPEFSTIRSDKEKIHESEMVWSTLDHCDAVRGTGPAGRCGASQE
jgi:hypothetical protein